MPRLVHFREIAPSLNGLISRSHFLRLSKMGLAPKTYRLSPKSAALFDIDEVAAFLAQRGLPFLERADA